MTVPPLPASPVVRVRLDYTTTSGTDMGSRFYLGYSGGAPSASDCVTLANDVGTAWNSHLAAVIYTNVSLTEVDVQDISSHTGAFGTAAMAHAGLMGGATLTANAATNIEFDIARRYRGGKPRMFLPPPDATTLANLEKYTTTFIGNVNTAIAAFFAQVTSASVGSMGALSHVNVSYYQGFVNITNSSGRTSAAPKYRGTALVDSVTGYACKAVVGSQRRRRTATTF